MSNRITDISYLSTKSSETTHIFPLHLYSDPNELDLSKEQALNLKPLFLNALSEKLELPQQDTTGLPEGVSAEAILAYIYAVLYSPTYRERYYEFLKYDFPRIPLLKAIKSFHKLAELGQSLINWHLLKDVQVPPCHRFEGEGDAVVSKVRYEGGHVWINATQHFTDVPESVWTYEIGAYQVCKKWLQDRRKSVLSHAEVRQYSAILVAIAETLRIMGEIDGVLDF